MRIGIVTPAFNVAPYIGDTIRSVLDQTHRDWTMVVVDDGSTDGTASVVQAFSDPRLKLISQTNAGVSAARNCGAAALQDCDSVLFLDGDDTLAPFALATLAAALTPATVAAAGAYERGGRVFKPALGDPLERLLVRNLFVNGGHVLIRREAVQLFRTDLRYGEDWEFWVRLALGSKQEATLPLPRGEGEIVRSNRLPTHAPSCSSANARTELISPWRRTRLRSCRAWMPSTATPHWRPASRRNSVLPSASARRRRCTGPSGGS